VCWSGLAERVERTLKKGDQAFVEGKLTKRKWQDKEGNDRYSTEVVANLIRSLGKREAGSTGLPDAGFPSIEDRFEPASPQATQSESSPSSTSTPTSAVEDDLPF